MPARKRKVSAQSNADAIAETPVCSRAAQRVTRRRRRAPATAASQSNDNNNADSTVEIESVESVSMQQNSEETKEEVEVAEVLEEPAPKRRRRGRARKATKTVELATESEINNAIIDEDNDNSVGNNREQDCLKNGTNYLEEIEMNNKSDIAELILNQSAILPKTTEQNDNIEIESDANLPSHILDLQALLRIGGMKEEIQSLGTLQAEIQAAISGGNECYSSISICTLQSCLRIIGSPLPIFESILSLRSLGIIEAVIQATISADNEYYSLTSISLLQSRLRVVSNSLNISAEGVLNLQSLGALQAGIQAAISSGNECYSLTSIHILQSYLRTFGSPLSAFAEDALNFQSLGTLQAVMQAAVSVSNECYSSPSIHTLQSCLRTIGSPQPIPADFVLSIKSLYIIQAGIQAAISVDNEWYSSQSIYTLQSCLRTRDSSLPISEEDILSLQSVFRVYKIQDNCLELSYAAGKIQKCYRDFIIKKKYIISKSADKLQRQIRQALVVIPGGSLDISKKRHEQIIQEKEETYSSFITQFKKGIQGLWSKITSLTTPNKKRSREEIDGIVISEATPEKRRKIDAQIDNYVKQLQKDPPCIKKNGTESKISELKKVKEDNTLLQEINEEKLKQKSQDIQSREFAEVKFIQTPRNKNPRRPLLPTSRPFESSSDGALQNYTQFRTEPFSSFLTDSAKKSIYKSGNMHSIIEKEERSQRIRTRKPTPFKRNHQEAFNDELNSEVTIEGNRNKKMKLTIVNVETGDNFEEKSQYKKDTPSKSVRWRDGYDRRTISDDPKEESTFLVEDLHDYQHIPHHESIPQEKIIGILKSPEKKRMQDSILKQILIQRPPVYPKSRMNSPIQFTPSSKMDRVAIPIGLTDDSAIHEFML